MYRTFEIKNFRCFDELKLDNLARVNLIGGKNNVGKTALLEALYLHARAYNPEYTLDLDASRGVHTEFRQPSGTIWDLIFNQFDSSGKVELEGNNTTTGQRSLQLRIVREPEELAQVSLSISTGRFRNGGSLSAERNHVLALDYDDEERHGTVYLTLDFQGKGSVQPVPPTTNFCGLYTERIQNFQ